MKFGAWNNWESLRKQAALRQEPLFAESLDEFDHAKEAWHGAPKAVCRWSARANRWWYLLVTSTKQRRARTGVVAFEDVKDVDFGRKSDFISPILLREVHNTRFDSIQHQLPVDRWIREDYIKWGLMGDQDPVWKSALDPTISHVCLRLGSWKFREPHSRRNIPHK